jgi:hypothetical protein
LLTTGDSVPHFEIKHINGVVSLPGGDDRDIETQGPQCEGEAR